MHSAFAIMCTVTSCCKSELKDLARSYVDVALLAFLMVFNDTFNNISAISWWSVLLVEEIAGPG